MPISPARARPPAAGPEAADAPPRRRWWSPVGAAAVVYLAGFAALALVARNELHKDLFFDEMWRADLIGAHRLLDRYDLAGAPIPFGWLLAMRTTSAILPDGFVALRVQALLLAAPLVVAGWALVAGVLEEELGLWRARLFGAAASLLTVALPVMAVTEYLNDYVFQAACTAVVVWLWWRYTHAGTRASATWLVIGVVALPVVTIAGLFVLPVLVVDLFLRARAGRDSVLSAAAVVSTAAASAGVALLLLIVFYADRTSDELALAWGEASLRHSGWDAVGHSVDRLWDAFLPTQSFLVEGGLRHVVAAQVAVVACTLWGLVVLGRRWVQYPITVGVAFVVSAAASAVVDWPLSAERLNLPWFWMVELAATVGLLWTLWLVARAVTAAALVAVPAALLLAPVVPGGGPEPYARGLTADLDLVAASPVARNVVLSYHFMSEVYAHDKLVNRGVDGREFVVVADTATDDRLTARPDEVAREAGWTPGTAVWCVLPFELGPEGVDRACRLTLPGLVREEHRLSRAIIVGWLPDR